MLLVAFLHVGRDGGCFTEKEVSDHCLFLHKKNVAKWQMFKVNHFKEMECKKNAICRVMQLVDAGESVTRKESRLSGQ